jgi:NitT/TauT family transport system substrate-binding protein
MKTAQKKILTLTLTLILIFCFTQNVFSMGQTKEIKEVSVRIGYQPTVFYSYLFLAEEKGMFQDAKLNVEFTKIPSANKMFQAYLAGQLDMTGLTATEIMLRGWDKIPNSFVCPVMVELNDTAVVDRIIVKKDSPIQSIADLKGKTVGSHPGTTVPNILKAVLTKNNVNPDDVKIQKLKPNLQVDSLLSGAVDAIICLEPTGSTLLASGECRVLYDNPFGLVSKNFPGSLAVLSKEFIQKNPDGAKRLIEVINKSVALYNEMVAQESSELDDILIQKLGMDKKVFNILNDVIYRLPSEWNKDDFDIVLNYYVDMGFIKTPIELEALKPEGLLK